MKWMLSTGVLIFGTVIYALSFGQGTMETHKEEIELTRATIKVQKKQIVAKNMQLTSVEKDKFWTVYRDCQTQQPPAKAGGFVLRTESPDTGQRPV